MHTSALMMALCLFSQPRLDPPLQPGQFWGSGKTSQTKTSTLRNL